MKMVNRNILTLDEFTIHQLRLFPQATGELSSLLRDIGLGAKRVNVEVNKAGLVDMLGDAGDVNVQQGHRWHTPHPRYYPDRTAPAFSSVHWQ